jgi:hypothetical protein
MPVPLKILAATALGLAFHVTLALAMGAGRISNEEGFVDIDRDMSFRATATEREYGSCQRKEASGFTSSFADRICLRQHPTRTCGSSIRLKWRDGFKS